jgi:hypothetical protein
MSGLAMLEQMVSRGKAWADRRKSKKPMGIIGENSGWGNHIDWFDFDARRIWGHLPNMLEKGDILAARMQSGKTALFRVTVVDRKWNPPDMFFASVEDVGYEDAP